MADLRTVNQVLAEWSLDEAEGMFTISYIFHGKTGDRSYKQKYKTEKEVEEKIKRLARTKSVSGVTVEDPAGSTKYIKIG